MTRFTNTIPEELLIALVERLAHEEESRSAVIRRLVEEALREAEEREKVEQWVNAYREHPQTDEEFGWQDWAAVEALKEVEWKEPNGTG
jgi:metal-responsive CopG/Arc/MetJ family transcriptional regulator